MAYFGKKNSVLAQVRAVKISGGYTVVVGRLSAEQEDECEAILHAMRVPEQIIVQRGDEAATQELRLPMEFRQYREAVLVRAIRSWDLTEEVEDAGGNITERTSPIDIEHIKQLDGTDRNRLFIEAKSLAKVLTEQQKGK